MEHTRLSSKGQIIIPKSIRKSKGLNPGDEFVVQDLGHAILLVPTRSFPRTTTEEVFGSLGYEGPALSLEEMDDAIARGARVFFEES